MAIHQAQVLSRWSRARHPTAAPAGPPSGADPSGWDRAVAAVSAALPPGAGPPLGAPARAVASAPAATVDRPVFSPASAAVRRVASPSVEAAPVDLVRRVAS